MNGPLRGCLGVVVFVVVAAGIVLRLAGGGDTEKRVPEVVGLSPDVAKQKLEDAGLGVDEEGGDIFFTSNDIVCDQQPKVGTMTSDDVRITIGSNAACGREGDGNGGAGDGAASPARQYASSVARELEEEPETQKATCRPEGDDLLSCLVVVGPTPSNPLSDNVSLRIRVGSDGNWDPIGPGP